LVETKTGADAGHAPTARIMAFLVTVDGV